MSETPRNHLRLLIYICLFIGFAGTSLLVALNLARTFYPRQDDPLSRALSMQTPQRNQNQPWWRRMFQLERNITGPPPGSARRGKSQVSSVGTGTGGVAGIKLSPDQLALREIAEAQVILANQNGVTDDEALQTMKTARIQGPFRGYEEQRFISRMLLMHFLDNQEDQQLLAKLKKSTVDIASKSEAGFEEIYYAGIACLLSGEAKTAEDYLAKALMLWPSRGRGYGSVYMFLMVSRAIQGESAAVFSMLDRFKSTYPDWVFVETYMCDLEDLERVYPESPLLQAIKGYVYALVLNYADAERSYQKALDLEPPDAQAKRTITAWRDAVRQERTQ